MSADEQRQLLVSAVMMVHEPLGSLLQDGSPDDHMTAALEEHSDPSAAPTPADGEPSIDDGDAAASPFHHLPRAPDHARFWADAADAAKQVDPQRVLLRCVSWSSFCFRSFFLFLSFLSGLKVCLEHVRVGVTPAEGTCWDIAVVCATAALRASTEPVPAQLCLRGESVVQAVRAEEADPAKFQRALQDFVDGAAMAAECPERHPADVEVALTLFWNYYHATVKLCTPPLSLLPLVSRALGLCEKAELPSLRARLAVALARGTLHAHALRQAEDPDVAAPTPPPSGKKKGKSKASGASHDPLAQELQTALQALDSAAQALEGHGIQELEHVCRARLDLLRALQLPVDAPSAKTLPWLVFHCCAHDMRAAPVEQLPSLTELSSTLRAEPLPKPARRRLWILLGTLAMTAQQPVLANNCAESFLATVRPNSKSLSPENHALCMIASTLQVCFLPFVYFGDEKEVVTRFAYLQGLAFHHEAMEAGSDNLPARTKTIQQALKVK